MVVGAALSGLLIPYITNQWQSYQTELELKTALIARISEEVSNMLATAELYNSGGREHQEYIDTNQGWQIKSSVIGSNLRVYYPNTYLGEEWDTYANLALEFYLLAAQDSMEVKNGTVGLIQEYYSACPNNIDWNELLDPNNLGFSDREFFHNWILLKNLITSTKIYNQLQKEDFSHPF